MKTSLILRASDLEMSEGTPFPQPAAAIAPGNANQLRELARYGDLVTFFTQISRDRKRVIVSLKFGFGRFC